MIYAKVNLRLVQKRSFKFLTDLHGILFAGDNKALYLNYVPIV